MFSDTNIFTVRHPWYVVVPLRIVKMATPANDKKVIAYFNAIWESGGIVYYVVINYHIS